MKDVTKKKLLYALFKRLAWHVMFISSVVLYYLWLLNTIWVFSVDLFLICMWLPRIELLLKCSYFGSTIKARCSYKMFLIKKNRNTYLDLLRRECIDSVFVDLGTWVTSNFSNCINIGGFVIVCLIIWVFDTYLFNSIKHILLTKNILEICKHNVCICLKVYQPKTCLGCVWRECISMNSWAAWAVKRILYDHCINALHLTCFCYDGRDWFEGEWIFMIGFVDHGPARFLK